MIRTGEEVFSLHKWPYEEHRGLFSVSLLESNEIGHLAAKYWFTGAAWSRYFELRVSWDKIESALNNRGRFSFLSVHVSALDNSVENRKVGGNLHLPILGHWHLVMLHLRSTLYIHHPVKVCVLLFPRHVRIQSFSVLGF